MGVSRNNWRSKRHSSSSSIFIFLKYTNGSLGDNGSSTVGASNIHSSYGILRRSHQDLFPFVRYSGKVLTTRGRGSGKFFDGNRSNRNHRESL
ncbi:hypothetical protein ACH5RR_026213 [Cinchona calisaya]|uniref:Ribosomal protein L2 n=1 Tax=Cinchona calisaya TaxID=153742 RepID=A0ABD2Z269_9GENT